VRKYSDQNAEVAVFFTLGCVVVSCHVSHLTESTKNISFTIDIARTRGIIRHRAICLVRCTDRCSPIHSFIHSLFLYNATWQNAVDNKKKYKHATWSV